MVAVVLSLNDQALSDWLNSQPMQDVHALFADHASVGTAINTALATITSQLAASGTSMRYEPVDVRPMQVKLADQGRKVEVIDGGFVVSPIITEEPAPPLPE
jgi:hypothetical protein